MFFVQKCPVFALVVILFLAVLLCHFLERKCLKIPSVKEHSISFSRILNDFHNQNEHIFVRWLRFDYALTIFVYPPFISLPSLIMSRNYDVNHEIEFSSNAYSFLLSLQNFLLSYSVS